MPEDYRAQVLQRTDIVELIGQTVSLRRRGKDYVGLCPFHQEKTPSFHVSSGKQFFHCFGCKASGNAIDFMIKRDRVEFKEAMELLARKAGIELPKFGGSSQKTGERQALLDAHSAACRFFENLLSHPQEGRAARDYLTHRGFNAETLKRFQVGMAAASWDTLLSSEVGRKFGGPLLSLGGLVKARDGANGFYDTFRNRIMFPIRDEGGRIIAFGGRVMPGSEDPAKYLNSPETPLFSKSRCVFGLDLARQRIVETRTVAVVEGYTDVIMAHQFGASNVVSVMGTTLTEQHVTILRRFADRIVLLFDADAAGDSSVERTVQLFLTQPVEIAVASMPAGLDPDEFLLAHGADGFSKLLADGADALTYTWKQLSRRFNASEDLTGQQKAAEQYLELLAAARGSGPVDAMRWGSALARVSRLTEIPLEELHRRFRVSRHGGRPTGAQARVTTEPTDNSPGQAGPTTRPLVAQDRAERWILGALLAEPGRWHGVQAEVHVEDFTDESRRSLAKVYWDHQRDEGEPVFNEFLATLPDEGMRALAVELIAEVGELADFDMTLTTAIKHLADVRRKVEEQKILATLRRTGGQPLGEQDQVALLKELQEKARQPDMRRVGM